MTPSSRTEKIPVTCDPHGHLERRPLADLTPFQGGFKDLDDSRYAKLRASILAEGFMAPVFVWKDKILDGHQRTTVLEREGWDVEGDVPVVEIEADDEAEAARKLLKLTSAYGKPTAEGVFDFMQTHDLDLGDFADVDLPDFDEGELEVLFGEDGLDDAPSDEVPEPPVTPVSREGDLWCMGMHRVLCGDSTSAEDVARLMDGKRAQMVFTDPPYGVGYDGGTVVREKLRGDENTDLYQPTCAMAAEFSDDKAALYLWHAGIKGIAAAAAAAAAGYEIRCEIVWNKNIAQFGALSAQYKQKHEPCYYCFKKGAAPRWFGPTNEVTVWDCNRAAANEHHPTQKPVELAGRAMGNSSDVGDLVLDLFLGGGCTLLGAEQHGRICYGGEIDPAYVDVSVTRWQEYANKEAILDGDGRTFSEVKAERLSGEDVPQAEAAG